MGLRFITVVVVACWSGFAFAGERHDEVALDWQWVSDVTIERCGLHGLKGMAIERLVEEGFAVVEDPSASGIGVRLKDGPRSLELRARRGRVVKIAQVPLPEDCDSTVQLDVIHELMGILRSFPRPVVPTRLIEPEPEISLTGWHVVLAAGGMMPSGFHPSGMFRGQLRVDLSALWLALAFEASATRADGVSVFEPGLSVAVYNPKPWGSRWKTRLGLDLAVLQHRFDGLGMSGAHADARLGLPVELSPTDTWAVGVMPHVRWVRVRHAQDDEVLYDSGYVGVSLWFQARLFGA